MKKCVKVTKERLLDINKRICKALLKGEIIAFIAGKRNGDLYAKFTGTTVNDKRYYGIWEKDLLEGRWHLLQFGEKMEVEPEWNDFVSFWTQQGENVSRMIA